MSGEATSHYLTSDFLDDWSMSEATAQSETAETQLESGTYEILRNRLRGHGDELRKRLNELNQTRKDVFGSIDLKLLNTERITTEHNCVPRDMVSVGDQFLFGYNVQFGLRTERAIADVFSVYAFDDETKSFTPHSLELIENAQFEKDFQDIYRYYKNATFAKFFKRGVHLYMVFQVGKSPSDIKSFKWLIEGDSLRYIDNRSDHEVRFPAQHEFEWTKTTRDMQRHGEHPHVSIEDRIFVETVGGDLTIKVEDNTESGRGIYEEPVENSDQTLDDADIFYAVVGHTILLKIRPYQEQQWRYIVFNEKIQKASRVDSIADACVLLPDDHGLMFSNGYYLQSGEQKTFDTSIEGLVFDRRVSSPNGEDTLFVFYQPGAGVRVLLGYNLIAQAVDTPIICHGFTMFRGGEMVLFKSNGEPQKHHAVQIWRTPYVGEDFVLEENTDSYLYKIGNRDIVRGMAECHEILGLIEKEDSYSGLYVDLVKYAGDILDSYFWIDNAEAGNLGEPLRNIKSAATSAVDEFEKVIRVRQNTREQTEQVTSQTREILHSVGRKRFDNIDAYVQSLSALRRVRGEIISLRDLRYSDLELVESLEQEVAAQAEELSQKSVQFLLRDDALTPYADAVTQEQDSISDLTKVSDAREVEERIATSATELEMLIEIVSNLKIDDATQRTTIIDNISAIFSQINSARASLKNKIQELAAVEGSAEFASQIKLLSQSVVNYLDVCDSPERCEEYLTKLMVQLEELEGQFAEFDDFIVELAEKREEIAGVFESRRMQLVEKRNKRANALADAADRILKGVKNRVESFQEVSEIHGYFAADLMIDKVRNIISDLEELGDSVKVDDIQSRLKTIREDAVRQLKDKQELYEDGDHIIRFGNHRFSVNTQVLDLTTVLRDGKLNYHLTGTDFYEPINNNELQATQDVWDMEVVSENQAVYRGEYLAYQMLKAYRAGELGLPQNEDGSLQLAADGPLLEIVRKFMNPRYREGYTKGVHDIDAARVLSALLQIESKCGLLRYSSRSRALGNLFWWSFGDSKQKKLLEHILTGFGTIAQLFPGTDKQREYISDIRRMLNDFVAEEELYSPGEFSQVDISALLDEAAEYLFSELIDDSRSLRGNQFVIAQQATDFYREFHAHLQKLSAEEQFTKAMKSVQRNTLAAFELACDWTLAFLSTHPNGHAAAEYRDEIALLLQAGQIDERAIVGVSLNTVIEEMIGNHAVIEQGKYDLHFNEFLQRLHHFEEQTIPQYNLYHDLKTELVDQERESMKLTEFQPRVLSSFVRNKLIDEVYLPLLGDNLAKQIGTTGDNKRTDRQGLLLLISPPGYGKTTLMEYVANRLGIIFMKINGPALGHDVTSLDPAAAPNAGAREEVEKLNLAFEMGDNVLIYLDDIQHCHSEFLQKFISLCDAQRKIEGVYKGKTRTYDFRGKKVAVVMAGNPYTESGEKFQIPDMLSNRADIYNLGEIIGDTAEAFELSYIENALTSNPVLARLASRSQKDVYAVVKIAERTLRGDAAPAEGIDLEGSYSMEELNEFVSTMMKLLRVRDVVLRVNQEYITSAAQHDDYRTEPPFLLQGSYRNMNRIAEKVLPVMNDDEIETLIQTSYQNDAQTLTSGTEANLLKFKELTDTLTEEEANRWEEIKRTFKQNVKMRGIGADDKVGQVIATLVTFRDGLQSISDAVSSAAKMEKAEPSFNSEGIQEELRIFSEQISRSLEQVAELANRPVEVNVPPLEMNWPEQFLSNLTAHSPAPQDESSSSNVEIVQPKKGQKVSQDDRITIVNRLPKTVYSIMESQFELMQGWLKPLTELSTSQQQQLNELQPKIEECLNHYRRLLHKLEAAHEQE